MLNLTNKWQFKEEALPLELQAHHLDHHHHHIQCPTVPAVAVAMHKSLKMTCRNQALKSGWQRPCLLFHNCHIAHKHRHSPLSSRCCSLLVPVNVPKHIDASSGQSKPLSQLQNVMVLSLGLGSGSSAASLAICFQISTDGQLLAPVMAV